MKPLSTDLSTWQFIQLGWVKFRAGSVMHCRLGGNDYGDGYITPNQDNIAVIQEVLGKSAPQPPAPGSTGSSGPAASPATRRSSSDQSPDAAGFDFVSAGFESGLDSVFVSGFDSPPPESPLSFFARPLAVVGRVEARALVVDRDRIENDLERRSTAHVALLGHGRSHRLEALKRVPVRAAVLVDRHEVQDGTSGVCSLGLRVSASCVPQ